MAEPLTFFSLGIGAWGAVVATVLGVRQVRHDRRSLKVICRWGVATHDDGITRKVVLVRAVNEGSRPVELHGVTFRFEDGKECLRCGRGARRPEQAAGRWSERELPLQTHPEEAEQEAQVRIAYAVVADASTNEYLAPYER